MVMDKARVVAAILVQARGDLAAAEQLTAMAIDEATSAESKAENKYDTRSLESSYIAAGQGQRLLSLRRFVSTLEAWTPVRSEVVGIWALVRLSTGLRIVLPDGGGRRVVVDGEEVVVVTPASPAGQALLGLRAGDTARQGSVEVEIEDVA